jgi:hypothetical protein
MGELRRFRDPTRVAAQNPIWSKALRPAWSRFDCVSRPTCRHGGALAGHLLNAQAHRRGEERLDRATLAAAAVGISLRGRAERQRRHFCTRARDRHTVPGLRSCCSARSQNAGRRPGCGARFARLDLAHRGGVVCSPAPHRLVAVARRELRSGDRVSPSAYVAAGGVAFLGVALARGSPCAAPLSG